MAVQIGDAACAGRMPVNSPSSYTVSITQMDGTVAKVPLADIPANRIGLSIREHCESVGLSFNDVMYRWMAFCEVLKSDRSSKWRRTAEDDPTREWFHESLAFVASELELNAEWQFDDEKFFERVEELNLADA